MHIDLKLFPLCNSESTLVLISEHSRYFSRAHSPTHPLVLCVSVSFSFPVGLALCCSSAGKLLVGDYSPSGISLELILLLINSKSRELLLIHIFSSSSGLYCRKVQSMDWYQPAQCWQLVLEERSMYARDEHFTRLWSLDLAFPACS